MIRMVITTPGVAVVGGMSREQHVLGTIIGVGAAVIMMAAFVLLVVRVNRRAREHGDILKDSDGEKP